MTGGGVLAERAVLVDDNQMVRLVTYAGEHPLTAVELAPMAAIALAGELIEAAHRHLSRPALRRRRGGDARRDRRARRNGGLRDLAKLIGSNLSLEQQAERIIAKMARYRPSAIDEHGGAERGALYRIAQSGLPVPGPRQLRRILESEV